ncbi:hypothetical protein VCRA217O17_20419 [Vibrio crassostreae]|nr:hypothetical protein VCRA217O17_20419 [Vibrio crassostreae]
MHRTLFANSKRLNHPWSNINYCELVQVIEIKYKIKFNLNNQDSKGLGFTFENHSNALGKC